MLVNPKNTSRECPMCNNPAKGNRKDECFCCTECGYTNDADSVGAMNILKRAYDLIGSLESPKRKKENIVNTC